MCFKNLPGAVIGQDLVDPLLGRVELLLLPPGSCDALHPAADPGPAAAAQVPQPAGQEEEEQAHPRPQRRGLTAGETWCIKIWILLIHNQASCFLPVSHPLRHLPELPVLEAVCTVQSVQSPAGPLSPM